MSLLVIGIEPETGEDIAKLVITLSEDDDFTSTMEIYHVDLTNSSLL